MLREIAVPIVCALGCLAAFACQSKTVEEKFFEQPFADRLQRLRQYSLQEQYKIFRFGNDKIEPPLMDLAEPISDRGNAAVPFLIGQLNANPDDLTVRDILLIFETMAKSRTYNVKEDGALMALLAAKIDGMRRQDWQHVCWDMLRAIKGLP
jgi:hypothetical protein